MRVCVIGGGVSGLPAIKECLTQGFEVVAYERTSDIGGLWNYRPEMNVIRFPLIYECWFLTVDLSNNSILIENSLSAGASN